MTNPCQKHLQMVQKKKLNNIQTYQAKRYPSFEEKSKNSKKKKHHQNRNRELGVPLTPLPLAPRIYTHIINPYRSTYSSNSQLPVIKESMRYMSKKFTNFENYAPTELVHGFFDHVIQQEYKNVDKNKHSMHMFTSQVQKIIERQNQRLAELQKHIKRIEDSYTIKVGTRISRIEQLLLRDSLKHQNIHNNRALPFNCKIKQFFNDLVVQYMNAKQFSGFSQQLFKNGNKPTPILGSSLGKKLEVTNEVLKFMNDKEKFLKYS